MTLSEGEAQTGRLMTDNSPPWLNKKKNEQAIGKEEIGHVHWAKARVTLSVFL